MSRKNPQLRSPSPRSSSDARAGTVAALAVAALLSACASTSADRTDDVIGLVRDGRYAEAKDLAAELSSKAPKNRDLARLAADAKVAWLLDLGRQRVFAGDGDDAIGYFELALGIDPTSAVAAEWILKTRVQLAEDSLDLALEMTGGEDLELAEAEYERVLALLPEHTEDERIERLRNQAGLGLSRVLLTQNYRETRSRSYFQDGIREFREYYLDQAHRSFGVSVKYDETNHRAKERREDVDELRADAMIARARSLEEEHYFFAARNQYRLVLLLEPENPVALDGLDRMDLETRARTKFTDADMSMRRGDFERAEELIGDAEQLTIEQTDSVGRLRTELENARLEEMYSEARGFEEDYLYGQAIEAYDRLLAETESYEDALARRATIEEFVLLAEENYAAALAATTPAEAISYLRRIQVFWPEYEDVEERLEELTRRTPKEGQGGAAEEPKPSEPAAEDPEEQGAAETPTEAPDDPDPVVEEAASEDPADPATEETEASETEEPASEEPPSEDPAPSEAGGEGGEDPR